MAATEEQAAVMVDPEEEATRATEQEATRMTSHTVIIMVELVDLITPVQHVTTHAKDILQQLR